MAHHDETVPVEMAPTAEVAVAVFEEIDGTLPFIVPAGIRNLRGFVNHQEGARVQNGEHRPVLRPDYGVTFALGVQILEHVERQGTPARDYAAQKGGFSQINTGVETERGLDFTEAVGGELDGVCFFEFVQLSVGGLLVQIDSIPGQDFAEIEAVDGGKRVETKD